MPPSAAWPPPIAPRRIAASSAAADLARDVVLGDVRDLVRHDARQLRLGGGGEEQALMDEDEAARDGEGVDAVVLDHEEVEVAPAHGALRGQLLPEALQVVGDLRVVHEGALVTQLPAHHLPEPVLIAVRDHLLGGAAEVGQVGAGGGRGEDDRVRRLGFVVREGDGRNGQDCGRDEDNEASHVQDRPPRAVASFPALTDAYNRVCLRAER